ncbi:MAG TPA: serine/threonine-protein kinase [Polyangia bacterium]|nr:serine/threonine-protein kinase [Polyangia bacterium]
MKICPTCSSHYPDDANFCPVDATRLKPFANAPAPAVAPVGTSAEDAVGSRFVLGERIAATPTGELFHAVDSTTGEQVHIKLIHQQVLPTAAMADRALREFKQLAKLKTERIARILDQGKFVDGRVYVVIEPLEGPTLGQLVELEGPLPFERAQAIILAAGEALTEAQKSGVIHRDVSPHCVVLMGEAVKVTDFGVAEPVNDKVFGTPAFLSPEQAEGKAVDQRSNIYSLSALFYYLLTGAPPFTGDTQSLLKQHLQAQPRPPSQVKPGVPSEADRVVLKGLEKSGGRRHLTLRQMLNEVAALGPGGRMARATEDRTRAAAAAGPEAAPVSMPMAAAAVPMAAAAAVPRAAAQVAERPGLLGAAVVSSPRATPTPARVVIEPARRETRIGVELSASPEKPMVVDEAMRYVQPAQPAAVVMQPAAVASVPPAAAPVQPVAAPVPVEAPVTIKEAQPQPVAVAAVAAASAPAPQVIATPQVQAASAPQAAATGAAPRRAFRETGWFKAGELEEAAAQGASGSSEDPLAGGPAFPAVVDEGSLTAEDHKRLSLKTGRTEAMAAVKAPVELPGERMSEADLLAEVDSSRKWLVASGIGVAVVVLIAAVYFLFVRAPAPAASSTGAPPAATAPK